MSAMSPEEMGRRMRFTNVESVNTVLRQGTSVALYLGHYGNWEWVSSMPLHLEKSAIAARIYHKLRNKAMDRIMLEHRGSHGAVNVDMYKTARYITELSARHQTSIIGFIADQSPKSARCATSFSFSITRLRSLPAQRRSRNTTASTLGSCASGK